MLISRSRLVVNCSSFVGLGLVGILVVDLLKFLGLFDTQKLLVGQVFILELSHTWSGGFSLLRILRFVSDHLLYGSFQLSFPVGFLFVINFLEVCVFNSGALITESTHAPKCLMTCDSIRESAQNQHGNSIRIVLSSEVQATTPVLIVDKEDGIEVSELGVHRLKCFVRY